MDNLYEKRERQYQTNAFEEALDDIINKRHPGWPARFDEQVSNEQAGEYNDQKAALPEGTHALSINDGQHLPPLLRLRCSADPCVRISHALMILSTRVLRLFLV